MSENWLAFYAAVVGTMALIINLSRFLHAVLKQKVKLSVSLAPHPEKDKNIERLIVTEENEPWNDRPSLVEVYNLTIRNTGNVDSYIENAGLICKQGKTWPVLISYQNDSLMLGDIPTVGEVKILAKSSKKMSVYLHRGEEMFQARKAFVIDGEGKQWTIKV